jgi:glycosyltransferase involved in cell wall biosynthesis
MKILILNWRSVRDPLEGGAERATFEHARRWVRDQGAQVTWLSPRYDHDIHSETIDGIDFQYIGLPLKRSIWNLIFTFPIFYFLVFWTYMTRFRGRVDVVIDQVHGLPYLTPLYVREKIIVYIHEIAGDIWDLMYPYPINRIGRWLEKIVFLPYKKTTFVGLSSVIRDINHIGIQKQLFHVVNNGVTSPMLDKIPTKHKHLTLIYINRLVKMKGPERAIEVFRLVHERDPQARFIISGRGEESYKKHLKSLIRKYGLSKHAQIVYLTDQEKHPALGQAHVLINPSYKEGWGLVNIEANCMGTPVVAFRVQGNTESVAHGISGYLFAENEIEQMADKIVELKDNQTIRQTALEYSKQFDWDKVSKKFYEILKK